MSDMKCPICNNGKIITYLDGTYECDNAECSIYNGTHTETFEALIRTRKALEIALDAIDKGEAALIGCQEADDKYISDVTAEDGLELMSKAYKQITALERKDE